ncbi:hypothetical protein Pst134EB_012354 [Puccinia striiformis f. sp. tritici]|nr:hypothetical protein Pst134EB_012354 [Puccinia striiformis f. sp. tritici]
MINHISTKQKRLLEDLFGSESEDDEDDEEEGFFRWRNLPTTSRIKRLGDNASQTKKEVTSKGTRNLCKTTSMRAQLITIVISRDASD